MAITNPENYFYVANGSVLKDLNETLSEIKSMSPETFSHHVNQDKNDFANWIKDVLNDSALAKKISSVKDQSEMASILHNTLNAKPKKAAKSKKKEIISSIKKRISHGE
jgi:hypothetical protein